MAAGFWLNSNSVLCEDTISLRAPNFKLLASESRKFVFLFHEQLKKQPRNVWVGSIHLNWKYHRMRRFRGRFERYSRLGLQLTMTHLCLEANHSTRYLWALELSAQDIESSVTCTFSLWWNGVSRISRDWSDGGGGVESRDVERVAWYQIGGGGWI